MAKKIRGRNEGTVHKRSNGTWRAQLSVNGKRLSFCADTKAKCFTWIRKMQLQFDQGIDFKDGDLTIEEYLYLWLNASRSALRPKTAHQYEQTLQRHILPYIGDVKIKDINLRKVEMLYADLQKAGVGIRTIRLTHSILHRALERAVKYDMIMRNPAHGAMLPRWKQVEMRMLDESQVSQFLIAAQNSPHEALYHLAITTGMRQGELFGLKWTDLQWNSGMLHIQRQVQRVPWQGWSFIEPKTKAGRRTIKLGEASLHALRLHKERLQSRKAVVGARWQDYDLIFPSNKGTPLEPSNMRKDFNRVLEKAGLAKIRFHDLRHTAASLMLNNGIPVIVVSKVLGHSKPSITMDIYGHLYNRMQDEVVRLMDELVTPIQVGVSQRVTRAIHQ